MEHEIKSELSDDGLPDNLRAPSDVHSTELLISSSDLLNLVNSDHHNFQEILAHEFHGMEGSAKALHVNLKHGLVSSKDEERRRIVFGNNTYIPPSWKCFHHFLLDAFKNPKKLILLACAVTTLGFGIKDHGVQEGSYEIGGILATVMVAAICATTNFYQVKGKFDRLSELRNKLKIDVVRGGRRREIPIFDVVVGDVVVLKMGDRIPADGVFIEGSSLWVKEEEDSRILSTQNSDHTFLKSGSKVIDGRGKMLVFSVGMNTHWNKMMSFSNHCYDFDEQTRLQASVDKIASYIGIFASVIAFFYLLGTAIRHIPGNTKDENVKWRNTIDMIPSVSRCVVEMVEGLLLAVTLAQAFCMKSIMGHGLVKSTSDCEAIGSATVICSNKVGTLTTNKMEVTEVWVGFDKIIDASFTDVVDMKIVQLYHQAVGLNTSGSVYKSSSVSGTTTSECFGSPTEKAILLWGVNKLGIQMETLNQGFTILRVEPFDSEKKRSGVFIKMEQDHLIHVHEKGAAEVVLAMCSNYYETNGLTKPTKDDEKTKLEEIINGMSASGLRCIAFAHKQIPTNEPNIHNEDGNNKLNEEEGLTLLGVIGIKNPCRVGMKEAIEACRSAGVQVKMITGDSVFTAKAIATDCGILEAGPHVINNGEEVIEGKEFRNYTEEERMNRVDGIQVLASSSPSDKFLMVQCLEKKGHVVAVTGDEDGNNKLDEEEGLTLLGVVGIKNPCRVGMKETIERFRSAGVEIKMITGDNVFTAKAIATECGILEAGPHVINNGEEVIEGREFRNYTEEERRNRVDGIRVMARSSSLDKLLMVQCLKKKGDVVAVTTGDHELAKESFDGLQFTLKVMRWQRGVYKNIQNYVQFQVPANAAALVINFICAVASGVIPLTASQTECVNLVMVILGVIALSIKQPNEQLMKKPPVNCRDAPLITNVMWRNISMQSVYQIIIILIVWFEGESIFDVDEKVKGMIVFNAFVLCQVFNLFNSRKMEERNVFKDVHKNLPFMSIVVVVIMFQVVMVEFHWLFADLEKLNRKQWGYCMVVAAISWPKTPYLISYIYGREDENTVTTWRV